MCKRDKFPKFRRGWKLRDVIFSQPHIWIFKQTNLLNSNTVSWAHFIILIFEATDERNEILTQESSGSTKRNINNKTKQNKREKEEMPKTTEKQKFKDSKTKHSKGEMPTRQNLTEAFCLLQNVKDEFYFDFRQRQL